MKDAALYECDCCHKPIGSDGKVRRRDGIVLTALCASCLSAGASLRLGDTGGRDWSAWTTASLCGLG